jgi:ribbon-helix-helix protein, copG family
LKGGEFMFEIDNKPNKEITFKVRMTKDEKEILDNLSKTLNISSSEVLRTGLILLADLNKNVFKVPLNEKIEEIKEIEKIENE